MGVIGSAKADEETMQDAARAKSTANRVYRYMASLAGGRARTCGLYASEKTIVRGGGPVK